MSDPGRTGNGRSKVDEELAGLARAHLEGGAWPSESEIRSRSAKLHQRRVAMSGFGALVLLVAIAVISVSIVGGSSTPHQTTLPTVPGATRRHPRGRAGRLGRRADLARQKGTVAELD